LNLRFKVSLKDTMIKGGNQ